MSSLKYWIWLSECKGIGLIKANKLLKHFGTPDNIYQAKERDYKDIQGINKADIKNLMHKDLTSTNEILTKCTQIGCRILTFQDSDYPDRLRNIYDPPIVLYIKGSLPYIDDQPIVGVVGTRSCTPYGIKTAQTIGYELSKNGIIVATGLARGIDTAATKGALKGGAHVIGVIGSGLDVIYPPENKTIYDDVASQGAVISEYPPGTHAIKNHFPARNRIISGISLGIAVIEAPKKSGALITAERALEQGRDVFALPGNVDAISCEGSNRLLREGAIPFMSADDIIDEYIELYPDKLRDSNKISTNKVKKSIDNTSKVDYIDLDSDNNTTSDSSANRQERLLSNLLEQLDGDEKNIAALIGMKPQSTDEIISDTELSAQQVLTSLTMLELGGHLQRNNIGKWEIIV